MDFVKTNQRDHRVVASQHGPPVAFLDLRHPGKWRFRRFTSGWTPNRLQLTSYGKRKKVHCTIYFYRRKDWSGNYLGASLPIQRRNRGSNSSPPKESTNRRSRGTSTLGLTFVDPFQPAASQTRKQLGFWESFCRGFGNQPNPQRLFCKGLVRGDSPKSTPKLLGVGGSWKRQSKLRRFWASSLGQSSQHSIGY